MSNKLIDKNRTINELSDSERKFSEIFINSPFGIVCFSKLGKIVDVNPAFCKIVDMPREEFVGKAVISLIKNRLSVKDIPIMLNRLKTLLLGKLVEPYELEFNGKIVEFHPPAKSYKNVFMTFVRDISELKESEQERENYITELKKAEERYHSIFENVGVAIWEEDFTELKAAIDAKKAKGVKDFRAYLNKHPEFVEQAVGMIKILDVNNESIKMYKARNKEDLINSLQKTFVTESLSSFKEELIAIFDGKREFQAEEITRDLHGKRIDILLKITFPAANKPFDRVLVSMMDITERKIANENIKAQKEHIELINSILRHDISNDLSVITSALRLYDRSPKKELLDEISNRIKHSSTLISRMKNLEMFLSIRSSLLPVSIKKIVNEIKGAFPSIHIDLHGNAKVMADNKLFSVFKNIVQNAIMHGKCTSIEIKVIKDSNYCMIKIADNGQGIPTEAKNNIFEKGYKFGKTGHTGLGLYIVKRSIEEYGGMVYTEDNKPQGTIVVIRLKLVN